jgi:hypothetical protein
VSWLGFHAAWSLEHIIDLTAAFFHRILANRQSAQRSRVRKLQYISELEMSVNALQAEVTSLSQQLGLYDHRRAVMTAENVILKQKLATLGQTQRFKEGEYFFVFCILQSHDSLLLAGNCFGSDLQSMLKLCSWL